MTVLSRGGTGMNAGGAALAVTAADSSTNMGMEAAFVGPAVPPFAFPEPPDVEGGIAASCCSTSAICERSTERLWMSALS